MRASKAFLPFVVLLLLLVGLTPTRPAESAMTDSIIISEADVTWERAPTANPTLAARLESAGARVVFEFANGAILRYLMAPPAGFQTLLNQITAHVVVGYANESSHKPLYAAPPAFQGHLDSITAHVVLGYANDSIQKVLNAAPPALQTRLDQVGVHVLLSYANAGRSYALYYPGTLIDDDAPPVITGLTAVGAGTISWTTDEFATSTVRLGTQSGVYTVTLTDPTYTKEHEVKLTGLVQGTTYYYRVSSTDLSGNTTTSGEKTFTPQLAVYLPLVLKK